MHWLYHHARWLYKFLSSYAYQNNCKLEELADEVKDVIRKLEENVKVNELIKSKAYLECS